MIGKRITDVTAKDYIDMLMHPDFDMPVIPEEDYRAKMYLTELVGSKMESPNPKEWERLFKELKERIKEEEE